MEAVASFIWTGVSILGGAAIAGILLIIILGLVAGIFRRK